MAIASERAMVGLAVSWTVVTRNRDIELVGELLVEDGGVKGDSEALSWTRDT